jgi:YD repeat-containing protein
MHRTSVVESSGDRVTWSYDSAYQLLNERRSGVNGYNVTHTYDAAGNRTVKIDSGARTTAIRI